MESCIFCKIARGEIPSRKLYEDDDVIAFHDVNPLAPVHFLIVPRLHVDSLYQVGERHRDVLGKLLVLAGKLARDNGCHDGFRTIINTGRIAGQEVYHLHVHVIGGNEVLPHMLHRPQLTC